MYWFRSILAVAGTYISIAFKREKIHSSMLGMYLNMQGANEDWSGSETRPHDRGVEPCHATIPPQLKFRHGKFKWGRSSLSLFVGNLNGGFESFPHTRGIIEETGLEIIHSQLYHVAIHTLYPVGHCFPCGIRRRRQSRVISPHHNYPLRLNFK